MCTSVIVTCSCCGARGNWKIHVHRQDNEYIVCDSKECKEKLSIKDDYYDEIEMGPR